MFVAVLGLLLFGAVVADEPPTGTPVPTCPVYNSSSQDVPPLPKLHQQFETRLEVKYVKGNYSFDIVEYYDYINNKGAVYQFKSGRQSALLYDFVDNEAYKIINDTCETGDPTDNNFKFFDTVSLNGKGHIGQIADLLNFGITYNETYISGTDIIRGMPVNHWVSCIEQEKVIILLDFYFTRSDYVTAVGQMAVPVRAVFREFSRYPEQDTKLIDSHEVFDFLFYRPGPIADPSVFEVPPGVACNHTKRRTPVPVLPDRFSMTVELVTPEYNSISLSKEYYDHVHNVSRKDLVPSVNMTLYGGRFGHRTLSVIDDFVTGLEYIIDEELGNCSVQSINASADAKLDLNTNSVIMRNASELFYMNKFNLTYKGKRLVRDIMCDIWAGRLVNWPTGANSTMEVAYTQSSWSVSSVSDGNDQRLVNIGVHTVHQDGHSEDYINHVMHFSEGLELLQAFDISPCYDQSTDMLHFMFQIPGDYETVVSGNRMAIEPAVKSAVAQVAGVRPIRITNIHFEQNIEDFVDIWMTMLEKPNHKVKEWMPPQLSLSTAFSQLQQQVQSHEGLQITFKSASAQDKVYAVVKDSLITDEKAEDPRGATKVATGHSDGAMVAVAIGMLVVGMVAGVAAGFFLWKFGSGIPYQIQD